MRGESLQASFVAEKPSETLVDDPRGLMETKEALAGASAIGVDLESNAMHVFRARLCFVQLSVPGRILVLDTLAEGVDAKILSETFLDPGVRKIFHDAQGDLRMLAGEGLRVRGLFDTQRAATLLGLPKVGLGDLVESRFGVQLAKEHQTADFGKRPVPEELLAYVKDDVRYLLPLAEELEAELRAKDIWEEFELECERIAEESTTPETLPRPKLPGGARDALGRAIAEAVDRIRYEEAEARDVPVGRALSNAAVGAIAARRPRTLKQLARIPGMKGSFLRVRGEEILRAIEALREKEARGELPEPPPLPRPDAARRKREERLKAWRNEAAEAREVVPMVVLPNPILERLAAEPPADLEALRQIPWLGEKRVRLYGRAILDVLHHSAAGTTK